MSFIIIFPIVLPSIIILINSDIINDNVSMQSNTQIINFSKTNTVETTKITNQSNPSVVNQLNSIDIPLYGLIAIVAIILILLSPIIKSAAIGTSSLELTTIDRTVEKKTELEFIEK